MIRMVPYQGSQGRDEQDSDNDNKSDIESIMSVVPLIDPKIKSTKYDHIGNTHKPEIVPPAYVQLYRKNEHLGNSYEPSKFCERPKFIGIYSVNVNGICDQTGVPYN